jgi:hypothetical protein
LRELKPGEEAPVVAPLADDRDPPELRSSNAILHTLLGPARWLKRAERRLRRTADEIESAVADQAAASRAAAPEAELLAAAIDMFEEGRDVGLILEEVRAYTAGNPRELKRLANLARFYLNLRNERRLRDRSWVPPEPRLYARWISLTSRWPDMMRWLQWGADEVVWVEAPSIGLVARRLAKLEELAGSTSSAALWRKSLRDKLGLSPEEDGQWLSDLKFFEFFKDEAARPVQERLSKAAAQEFW